MLVARAAGGVDRGKDRGADDPGDLAKRLGIPEQQVQRWETNGYTGVGLERVQQIADALGLQMRATVAYDISGASSGTGRDREPGKARRSASSGPIDG